MATNLTGTSTSGTTTIGNIIGTGVPSIARSPLTSVCSPLGVQLPLTMNAKKVKSEFVDFGQLLEKSEHLCKDDTQYFLAVDQGETLVWQELKSKCNTNSVNIRTSFFFSFLFFFFFFFTFSAVYLSAHPHKKCSRNVEICPDG